MNKIEVNKVSKNPPEYSKDAQSMSQDVPIDIFPKFRISLKEYIE
jgi:hypothetical protein